VTRPGHPGRVVDLKALVTEGTRAWDPDRDTADPDAAHRRAEAFGAKCSECPLRGHKEGPVFPTPSRREGGPLLAIVGEAPGKQEVRGGEPFIGPSGTKGLDPALDEAGVSRAEVHVTNALLCRPPDGRPLKPWLASYRRRHPGAPDPLDCCLPRLRNELRSLGAPGVLTLGSVALERTARAFDVPTGNSKRAKPGDRRLLSLSGKPAQRGHPFRLPDGSWLVASYHPADGLRTGPWKLGAIRRDAAKLARIVRQGGLRFSVPSRVIAWAPPMPDGSPWAVDLPDWYRVEHDPDAFLDACRKALDVLDAHPRAILTVDIETAGVEAEATLRIINLHFRAGGEEWVVILPYHFRSGARVAPRLGFSAEVDRLGKAFIGKSGRKLAFQNGTFDTGHLLRLGIMTSRSKAWLDTMPAHRASEWGEERHNLGAILADQADRVGDLELYKGGHLHGEGEKEA